MSTKDETHFFGQVNQKALIENSEGKILMVQYPDDDMVHSANKWDLPGGRLNVGETALEGLKREVKEEIGADIEVDEMLGTGVVGIPAEELSIFLILYRCSLTDPGATLTPETGEIGKIEWRDKKDILSLPMINEVYKAVLFG